MSYIFCPVPQADNPDLFSADEQFRFLTNGLFGCYPPNAAPTDPNGYLDLTVLRSGNLPGAICAKSGNYFHGEDLTTDGQGRLVGKRFKTNGPAVPYSPPLPPFGVSPGNPD